MNVRKFLAPLLQQDDGSPESQTPLEQANFMHHVFSRSAAPISNEIGESSVDRKSYVAFVINVVATLGLSIGLALLLFSSRPRADDEGASS